MSDKCDCSFCRTYEKYKWAVVSECPCFCHEGDGETGHDGLCCEFPNVLKKNNPFMDLESAEYYKKYLNIE